MGQRENLWGRYRPPTGLTLSFQPDTDGMRLGGQATLTIHHHRPEPDLVVVEELNEWAAAWLPQAFEHTWDAWKYGSAPQVALAFQTMAHRLRMEWHGE